VRVAFVAPFYGPRASGGAEAECRQTALRLAGPDMEVDVLTTCLLDLAHGLTVNAHPAGVSHDGPVRVRRFPAEDLAPGTFATLNRRLIDGETLTPDEARQFMAQNVNSFALYRFIDARRAHYDWFCFIPYLFGTTCYGTQLCPEKSVLIPCLHDEGYARLPMVRAMFARVRRVVFHTPAEMRLAETIYGHDTTDGRRLLIGEGVDTHFASDPDRFRARYAISAPFVLYAGRKDQTKNVDTLIAFFAAYKRARANDLKLVLLGPCEAPIPADMRADILDLGFVLEQDKQDAYSAARVLGQPSLNESFSIVMMEAWACGTPCLVHGGCGVTREHVVRSGGGLYFESYGEFAGALDRLAADPDLCAAMGAAGRRFVNANYAWPVVMRRYRETVFAPAANDLRAPSAAL
jgi:glycosyltransferase involved in cell wall biosynthesis